jgi:outer membrane protein assembly complex protein YaeT
MDISGATVSRQIRASLNRTAKLLLFGLLLATGPTRAEPTSPANGLVLDIRVEGNQQMTTSAVLALVKTRVGQPYDESIVKADVQRMLGSKRFERVEATETKTEKGWIVTFKVVERSLVSKLLIQGAKNLKEADLRKDLTFGAGDPLNMFDVEAGKQSLLNKYRGEGYYFASVTYDEEALKQRREVVYRIVEGSQARVRKTVFEGNRYFSAFALKMKIGTSQRFWPFVPGNLDRDQVDRDVGTIRGMYVTEGFLDAEVGSPPPTFSNDNKDVTIRFVIREGERYRVGQIRFQGNTVIPNADLARRIKFRTGNFLVALTLRRDTEAVQNAYGELGYINAKVLAKKVFKETPGVVDLVFEITEDDQYRVGRIDIRGNQYTQGRVIRRELRFFPEQLFDTVAVEESRNRLRETMLFDEVNITPVGPGEKVRDALVEVKEGKTARFLVGVGVSTDSGLVGTISYSQRNFDLFGPPKTWKDLVEGRGWRGAGQTLTITAEPGTELMRFSIDWFEPYLLDQPYSLGSRTFLFSRIRESYDETRFGEVVSVGHRFPNRWYGELSGRIEGVDISHIDSNAPKQVTDVKGTSFLVGPKVTVVRDRTDSRWMPSTGDRLQLSYEQIAGDFTFGRASADYRAYRTVYVDALDRKHILAGRVTAGGIIGDAPVFEEFYAGGSGSIRGFKYRGVGPRAGMDKDPVGGDFLLLAGGEYSFPLVGDSLRGVLFLDTGTVEQDIGIKTYRASAGFGVRWVIPFFGPVPMSFDFGFPISKQSGDETQVFSFSVGWMF